MSADLNIRSEQLEDGRKVFFIEAGNLSKEDAAAAIQEIVSEYRSLTGAID